MHATEDQRLEQLRDWLAGIPGVNQDSLKPASADASFRRYFRVDCCDGTAIAMDAPPAQEDSGPFVRVAGFLEEAGLNAPRILQADLKQGFLLLSDLGSTQYLDVLDESNAVSLYRDAIDALLVLQRECDAHKGSLPSYDADYLAFEMSLFHDWLCEKHLGLEFDEDAETQWQATVNALVDNALAQPQVFVHRDYHSRNLMQTAVHNPGILDFQDAMCGPLTYDLVSLLKDCYVTWPEAQRDELARYFHTAAGVSIDWAGFRRWLDLTGAQRHLKAAGIFARLKIRDGKPGYLLDVPRTLAYIMELRDRYDELEWLCGWIEQRVLPALESKS